MTVKAGQNARPFAGSLSPKPLSTQSRRHWLPAWTRPPRRPGPRAGSPGCAGERRAAGDVRARVAELASEARIVAGGDENMALEGLDSNAGAFYPATLLRCDEPLSPRKSTGGGLRPVATVMPYASIEDAGTLARRGKGPWWVRFLPGITMRRKPHLGCAPWHGRMLVINRDCAGESTGHGSPLANLIHGGPGRAGGGEELGGARAIKHYMQRTALAGSPTTLMAITTNTMPVLRKHTMRYTPS